MKAKKEIIIFISYIGVGCLFITVAILELLGKISLLETIAKSPYGNQYFSPTITKWIFLVIGILIIGINVAIIYGIRSINKKKG